MRFQIIGVVGSDTSWVVHDGVSKLDGAPGRGSGRYPLGSGKRPFRHQVEGTSSAKKRETVKDAKDNLNKKQNQTLSRRLFGKKKDSAVESTKKNPFEMSDEELDAIRKRNELVKNYLESEANLIRARTAYNDIASNKRIIRNGKEIITKMLINSAQNIGQQLITYELGTVVNKLAKKDIVNPKKGQKDK